MAKDTRTDLHQSLSGVSTVFITGATSGIGQELANTFLASHFKVIAIGRNNTALKELEKQGAITYALDLCKSEDIKRAGMLLTDYEPELIYHCAGYTCYGNLHERALDELLAELRLHLESYVVLLHHFGQLPSKKRTFMGFSSALAYVPAAGMSLYSSAKKAIQTLCRLTDIELSSKSFRVLTCQAGPVTTAFHDRASKGYYSEKSHLSINAQKATKIILWQTEKGISSYPIGPLAWIGWIAGKCLPFRLVAKVLWLETLRRLKRN